MPPRTNLLLIDDDSTTREVLTLLLEAEGWRVTPAEDGAAAIHAAASLAPSVVLSDLHMPGMPVTQMAADLRRLCGPQATLLAMTATAQTSTPAGFDGLLLKPFLPGEVRTMIDTLRAGPATQLRSPENSGAESPTIALETFQQLRSSMPAAQLRALYNFALDDALNRAGRMSAACLASDDISFRREAHALKGSCAMIGALRLRDLAAAAETDGIPSTSLDPPLTSSHPLPHFYAEIGEIRHMLEGLLDQ